MILITTANTITTEPSKIISVASEIFRVDDGVIVGECEGVGEGFGEGEGVEVVAVGEGVGEGFGEGEGVEVVAVGEGVGEVEVSTKFAGSISGAIGVWLKLNEFIMS